MRQNAMRARPKRRGKLRDDGERSVIADTILDRDFQADRPNRKCPCGDCPQSPAGKELADFTCIRTAGGWLCVAVVPDLFARRVVGWSPK
jgi:putative transposase